MEEATRAPSSLADWDPKRLRASGRDGETVMTEPPSPLRMLLSRHTSVGPDRKDRISVCPLARIFTEVPPTSMTSTFLPEGPLASTCLIKDPTASAGACPIVARPRLAAGDDLALIT